MHMLLPYRVDLSVFSRYKKSVEEKHVHRISPIDFRKCSSRGVPGMGAV